MPCNVTAQACEVDVGVHGREATGPNNRDEEGD